jgi:hypothetical protein
MFLKTMPQRPRLAADNTCWFISPTCPSQKFANVVEPSTISYQMDGIAIWYISRGNYSVNRSLECQNKRNMASAGYPLLFNRCFGVVRESTRALFASDNSASISLIMLRGPLRNYMYRHHGRSCRKFVQEWCTVIFCVYPPPAL